MTVLRALFVSSRPISWINTAYPFAAAYLLTAERIDAALIVGTLFFLVPYNLAMYGINDVFDYPSDMRNPRKGGVQGGVLPPLLHRPILMAAALSCAPFLIALMLMGDLASTVVLAISMVFVVAYSAPPLRWKETPGLDSFTSAVHFVSPAVFALVLAGARWDGPLVLAMLAFLCWGMASHAFGAVQDVEADRAAGIASIGTALGAARTVRVSLALYAAAGLLVLGTVWPGPLASVAVVPYLVTVGPYRSLTEDEAERATAGWKRFLVLNQFAGFWITMLLIWRAMTR